MSAPERAALAERVRRSAGLFALDGRGVLAVRGGDRVRWLNGMISNDVARLEPGPERSGCRALLLTRQGRIVADLHVLLRGDEIWLETERASVELARERLSRLVIADDVELADLGDAWVRLGVEGPATRPILGALAEDAGDLARLAPDACAGLRIAGADVVAAAFGWSGEDAIQLFVPRAAAAAAQEALVRAVEARGGVAAGADVLELLRVEAGRPRAGAELSEEVLPPEVRLEEEAISYTKGCYTGQEIVARLRSRGQVAHLLVGLGLASGPAPERGAPIERDGERIGEVTSGAVSARAGAIALGFVRRAHAEPGTRVHVAGRDAEVRALPFVARAPGARGD